MSVIQTEKGLTLIEILAGIAILALVMMGVTQMTDQSTRDTKAAITALHIKNIGLAANDYIKNKFSVITPVATATTPVVIKISDLTAGNYLPAGYAAKNAYDQNTCVLVLQPSANNLLGLVMTEGGTEIDDLTLGQIAGTIGGAGGGIYSTATTTIRGAMGGWSFSTDGFKNNNKHVTASTNQKCDGTDGPVSLTKGHLAMALWFSDGSSVSATLYRDAVPGNPSLNTMNTPILMGSSTIKTEEATCAGGVAGGAPAAADTAMNGALARDAGGAVLACEGGKWKRGGSAYWKDPVDSKAALNALPCTAAQAAHTRIVKTPTGGSGPRAYSCDGVGTWVPLAVDDQGNLNVPGTLTADTISAHHGHFSRTNMGPCCGDTGSIDLAEDTGSFPTKTASISFHNAGKSEGNLELAAEGARRIRIYDNQGQGMGLETTGDITSEGKMTATGNISSGQTISGAYAAVSEISIEDTACGDQNGLISKDKDGRLLSCQNGFWRRAQGIGNGSRAKLMGAPDGFPEYINCGDYGVYHNVIAQLIYTQNNNPSGGIDYGWAYLGAFGVGVSAKKMTDNLTWASGCRNFTTSTKLQEICSAGFCGY